MKNICVFCGARGGTLPAYERGARGFGAALAARGLHLIYGGGAVGLMGAVAEAAIEGGANVTAIIPGFLSDRGLVHPGCHDVRVVTDLFARKTLMVRLGEAFVALPGGIGTADEVLEVLSLHQLGQLDRPIALLNLEGYFEPWLAALRHCVNTGFAMAADLEAIIIERDPQVLIERLIAARRPPS